METTLLSTFLTEPELTSDIWSSADRARLASLFEELNTVPEIRSIACAEKCRASMEMDFDAHGDDDLFWSVLLDWFLYKHRWVDAVAVFETHIKTQPDYTEQPPYTFYMAVAMDQLGRQEEARTYLCSSLDDGWGPTVVDRELASRLAPKLVPWIDQRLESGGKDRNGLKS